MFVFLFIDQMTKLVPIKIKRRYSLKCVGVQALEDSCIPLADEWQRKRKNKNKMIFSSLGHYVLNRLCKWDIHVQKAMYAFNMEII